MSELYIDKYKPQTLDDYISDQYTTILYYLDEFFKGKKNKGFLLYGKPGTGKSALINVIGNHYNADMFVVNTSDQRNKLDFAAMNAASLTDNKRIIVLEEIDGFNQQRFKELVKIIDICKNPIILICNDINLIPNIIKQKCYIKEIITNKFNLKALATKIIEKESLEIDSKELNDNLVTIDSYRGLFDYLQFGITSNKGSFNTNKDDLKSEIQFISDNSSNPNLISQADIFLKRSQLGYKNGTAISKYIIQNINVKSSDYPRTYRLIYEVKSKKKNNTGTIKILGFK
jgi:hypothetical protein